MGKGMEKETGGTEKGLEGKERGGEGREEGEGTEGKGCLRRQRNEVIRTSATS